MNRRLELGTQMERGHFIGVDGDGSDACGDGRAGRIKPQWE
jgi:hypothetical protein